MDLQAMQFAHDLKMPIQLIYSCVQLLEMELSPNARAEGYLQMLLRSADQLNTMVSGALEGDAAPGGELQLRLRDVVAEVRALCRRCAVYGEEKGLFLHFETNAARFLMPLDTEKLQRILQNLISNALRFSPTGGHVAVRLRVQGDAVEVCVADEGCGVPENMRGRIFEPGVTTGGHGFGLSAARDLARSMGGDVYLQSAPGRGSCFALRLPVRKL